MAKVSKEQREQENRARFQRLAAPRVNRCLKSLKSVERLMGHGYTSTPEERQKIIAALGPALDSVLNAANGTKQESAFTL